MLPNQFKFLDLSVLLDYELSQSKEEGKDIKGIKEEIKLIQQIKNKIERSEKAGQLLDELSSQKVVEGYKYVEPVTYDEIVSKSRGFAKDMVSESIKDLEDTIKGGWYGRIASCLFGKPVELMYKEDILAILKNSNNYPMTRFLRTTDVPDSIKSSNPQYDIHRGWLDRIDCAPNDDDTNYTILALMLVEKYGRNFKTEDIAENWLTYLSVANIFTAEVVAFRNIMDLIDPQVSGAYRNIYREWIGALIRTDLYGYINIGNPKDACQMAYKDGVISHTKNGVYGGMLVSALISMAPIIKNLRELITYSVEFIPEKSRLREAVFKAIEMYDNKMSNEEFINYIHDHYDEKSEHDWTHVISNTMIIVFSLLQGDYDFIKSLQLAVECGFDTDSNSATIGSIIGMSVGYKNIPQSLLEPLKGKIRTNLTGLYTQDIDELVNRTIKLATNEKDLGA